MMEQLKNYIENNKKEFISILLITLIAFILRLISLFHSGDLWLDEIYSYYFSSKNSILDVVKSLYTEDLHTPLYFILLHIWIKFWNILGLGENDAIMRFLGFIPSFLSIPLTFYIAKKLFNKKCAYCASIILAISPFAIYYSTELRFYGFLLFLSLISAYFFTEYITLLAQKSENPYAKKYTIGFIISNLCLLYTFNISFIFVFFQFLCGIFYLKKTVDDKDIKDVFTKFLKAYILIGILYTPGFIIAFHGMFSYKNSICAFNKDIFIYKIDFISILLQSWFTGNFFYGITNAYQFNDNVLSAIFKPRQIFTILYPVIFCLTGFIYAIICSIKNFKEDKSKNLFLFLLPAFLFLLFELIMAQIGAMSLIARYTILTFPIVIIAVSYGFSLFNFNKIRFGEIIKNLFFIALVAAISYFVFHPDYNSIKKENQLGTPVKKIFSNFQIKQDDLILVPFMGKLHKRYLPKNAEYIDFEITDMLLNDVRRYFPIVFDDKIQKSITQKNAKTLLKSSILSNEVNPNIEKFLKSYFDKMHKGQAFILVVNDIQLMAGIQNKLQGKNPVEQSEYYDKRSLYYLLSSKIIRDILIISNNNLKSTNYFIINDSRKPDNNTGIFIFLKK